MNQSAIHTCPTVGDNKPVCHKFITKGRSCKQGQNCRFAHITSRSNAADLATLHQWAATTEGISWLAPVPNQHRQGQPNGGRANTGGANTGRATNTGNSDCSNTNDSNATQSNTSAPDPIQAKRSSIQQALALPAYPPICPRETVSNRMISAAMCSKPASMVSATAAAAAAATTTAIRPSTSGPPQDDSPMPSITKEATGSSITHCPTQETPVVCSTVNTRPPGAPRLTKSMNSEYLNRSRISTAYALQKEQNFGKDTVHQSFTCDKSFWHVVLHIYESKYLVKYDLKKLWILIPTMRRLWRDWKQSRKVTTEALESLREPNPNWQNQERIDNKHVSLQLALLLHFKFNLAAVQQFLGGQHTTAHRDPNEILPQVQGLVSEKVFNDVEQIMRFGAPAQFNEHGSCEQFLEYRDYGNHKSIKKHHEAFRRAMNKEDK
jgi:hypothetical protein